MAVTYSATAPSTASVLLVMPWSICPTSRRLPVHFGGLLLERRDQARAVELGDVIVEAGLPPALDRRRRNQRGQRDDRHRSQMRIRPDGLGEFEPVHLRHFDVRQHDVERL